MSQRYAYARYITNLNYINSIYHWAMLALYGETYWFTHPECEKLPDSYEKWIESALAQYSLDDCYEFISKNNNVTNKA